MRILVANEPRAYREVLAATLPLLRPALEVIAVEPDDLDRAIRRHVPQIVLCSRLTEAVQSRPLSWIVLYPDGASYAVTNIGGRQLTLPSLELADILSIIDETERLDNALPRLQREYGSG